MTDLPQTVGRLDRLRTLFPGVISLSGVRLQPDQEAGHLSAEDLKRLQPIDILRSFVWMRQVRNSPQRVRSGFRKLGHRPRGGRDEAAAHHHEGFRTVS